MTKEIRKLIEAAKTVVSFEPESQSLRSCFDTLAETIFSAEAAVDKFEEMAKRMTSNRELGGAK